MLDPFQADRWACLCCHCGKPNPMEPLLKTRAQSFSAGFAVLPPPPPVPLGMLLGSEPSHRCSPRGVISVSKAGALGGNLPSSLSSDLRLSGWPSELHNQLGGQKRLVLCHRERGGGGGLQTCELPLVGEVCYYFLAASILAQGGTLVTPSGG